VNFLRWIDSIVIGLIDLYGTSDIYDLYSCLGLHIERLPLGNVLLREGEAFYSRGYLGVETVFIRNDLSKTYERFVLAHELGHAILHVEIQEAAFNLNLINKGKMERQANYFAFHLLDINPYDEDFENFTIEQIACALEVPVDALRQFATL